MNYLFCWQDNELKQATVNEFLVYLWKYIGANKSFATQAVITTTESNEFRLHLRRSIEILTLTIINGELQRE